MFAEKVYSFISLAVNPIYSCKFAASAKKLRLHNSIGELHRLPNQDRFAWRLSAASLSAPVVITGAKGIVDLICIAKWVIPRGENFRCQGQQTLRRA